MAILGHSRFKRRTMHATQENIIIIIIQYMAQKKHNQKKTSSFVIKLVTILQDPASKGSIQWISCNGFSIVEANKFSKQILPKYYKHHNLSSFIRQLNIYGFSKLKNEQHDQIYTNPNFIKNNKKRLRMIQRRSNCAGKDHKSDNDSSHQLQNNSSNFVKNISALKAQNQEYRLKNKEIAQQIQKLQQQRRIQISLLINFLEQLISNNKDSCTQLSYYSLAQQEQQYYSLVQTIQHIQALKNEKLLHSQQIIYKLLIQLEDKKKQLQQSINIKKTNMDLKDADGASQINQASEREMDLLQDRRLEQYNQYFMNDPMFQYDHKEAQNFLDQMF